MKTMVIAFVLLACGGCTTEKPLTPASTDADVVGHTVRAAMQHLSLQTDQHFVINEPPGVPRGIDGTTPNGDLVELYVRRSAVPFSERMDWTIDQFLDKKVIGIARRHANSWTVHGEVMLIRTRKFGETK
jgi:hypothetical protein